MKMLNVCCLTKFSFEYTDRILRSDGFLGREEWGFFGISWNAMKKFMVIGFKTDPGKILKYKHELPLTTEVAIVGPVKKRSGNIILRGIKELFGIMAEIIRWRASLKDLDIIFSEFREYTFFEIALIKIFARKAKTVTYFISDFPESNYSRHHNIFFKYLLRLLMALCQILSDDVWFISEHLLRKYRLHSTKCFGVVRTSNLKVNEIAKSGIPRHLGGNKINLICVARIEKEKRLDLLLHVIKSLNDREIVSHLTIAGEGALLDYLKNMAESLGIRDKIEFTGHILERERLFAAYRKADLSLLASEHEGLGLVLVESISQGVPAIANRFEGSDEIINDGVDGYLVRAESPDGLVKGIAEKIEYLYKNHEQYEKLSENGPSAAAAFTLEAVGIVQRERMRILLEK